MVLDIQGPDGLTAYLHSYIVVDLLGALEGGVEQDYEKAELNEVVERNEAQHIAQMSV